MSLGKSLFTDYLSSNDVNEAIAAAQELVIPGFGKTLVDIGIKRAFDSLNATEQDQICEILSELGSRKILSGDDISSTVSRHCTILEDTMLDIPLAPRVLGTLMGNAIVKNVVDIALLGEQASSVEGAEPRRLLTATALNVIKAVKGEELMVSLVKEASMNIPKLLERDEEMESYLPTLKEFAAEQGLNMLI